MKQNPCRYCALSWEYKGKHYPSYELPCAECENINKHREYLKSKRMFEKGEQIKSLDVLLSQEWVIWNHSTKHIKVLKNMQLGLISRWLNNGNFYMAIRKESEEDK